MLVCGKNFKGTNSEICNTCNIYDDEGHRLNHCSNFRTKNNCDANTKTDFTTVFSDDIGTLRKIIAEISKVWNVLNANGTMLID